jgi:hypothetical protein
MTIEPIDISILTLPNDNPRKITKNQFEKLCKSIKEDPDFLNKRPVLVNLVNGLHTVYAGSQRVRAAKKLGFKTIPCIVDFSLDGAIIKKRSIQDNVHHGEFDWDLLSALCDPAELLELGMTENDLKIDSLEKEDNTILEESIESEQSCSVGDVYHLNEHALACVDCTDVSVFDPSIRGEFPVLLMTSAEIAEAVIERWRNYMESNGKEYTIKKNGELL